MIIYQIGTLFIILVSFTNGRIINKRQIPHGQGHGGPDPCDLCHRALSDCSRFPFKSVHDQQDIIIWAECMQEAFQEWKYETGTDFWPNPRTLIHGPVGPAPVDRQTCFDDIVRHRACIACGLSRPIPALRLQKNSRNCWDYVDQHKQQAASQVIGQHGHAQVPDPRFIHPSLLEGVGRKGGGRSAAGHHHPHHHQLPYPIQHLQQGYTGGYEGYGGYGQQSGYGFGAGGFGPAGPNEKIIWVDVPQGQGQGHGVHHGAHGAHGHPHAGGHPQRFIIPPGFHPGAHHGGGRMPFLPHGIGGGHGHGGGFGGHGRPPFLGGHPHAGGAGGLNPGGGPPPALLGPTPNIPLPASRGSGNSGGRRPVKGFPKPPPGFHAGAPPPNLGGIGRGGFGVGGGPPPALLGPTPNIPLPRKRQGSNDGGSFNSLLGGSGSGGNSPLLNGPPDLSAALTVPKPRPIIKPSSSARTSLSTTLKPGLPKPPPLSLFAVTAKPFSRDARVPPPVISAKSKQVPLNLKAAETTTQQSTTEEIEYVDASTALLSTDASSVTSATTTELPNNETSTTTSTASSTESTPKPTTPQQEETTESFYEYGSTELWETTAAPPMTTTTSSTTTSTTTVATTTKKKKTRRRKGGRRRKNRNQTSTTTSTTTTTPLTTTTQESTTSKSEEKSVLGPISFWSVD